MQLNKGTKPLFGEKQLLSKTFVLGNAMHCNRKSYQKHHQRENRNMFLTVSDVWLLADYSGSDCLAIERSKSTATSYFITMKSLLFIFLETLENRNAEVILTFINNYTPNIFFIKR